MIIGSTAPPVGRMQSSVVPQSPAQLSALDHQVLTGLGIPPDKWNNLNALWALYNQTEYGVLSLQVSRPGMELSCNHVLDQCLKMQSGMVSKFISTVFQTLCIYL